MKAACSCGWRELQVLLLLAVPTIITTAAQQIVIVLSQVSNRQHASVSTNASFAMDAACSCPASYAASMI
jgi:hypothetical protein